MSKIESESELSTPGERWSQQLRRRAVLCAGIALLLVLWLRILVHLILGVVIGITAYVSIHRRPATATLSALAIERWRQLATAFRDVLAAQLRIALVNAVLTAIYLLVILPAFGVRVPLGMT